MNMVLIGLSHKTASIEIRERITFSASKVQEALQQLVSRKGIEEAVIISTCNRTEIYATCFTDEEGSESIIDYLSTSSSIDKETLRPFLYHKSGKEVVKHLFWVVSSLDSMVLGEAQIQGQVREAYKQAESAGTAPDLLGHLFKQALTVGKKVRSTTSIGAQSVSISTAAVTLAKRVFDTLDKRKILIIGAGEMAELTAQYLMELGAHSVVVANRTFENAQEIAKRFDGEAVRFDDLEEQLRHADIVISSTAAPSYVIKPAMVKAVRKRRGGHSLLLVDIALPRDIDPACNDIDDVYVYDIDDLEGIIELNKGERQAEAAKVEELIDEDIDDFMRWYQGLSVQATIKEMRQKADRIANEEVERALRKLDAVADVDREVLQNMAQAIVKKVLHGPTARLNKQAANPEAYHHTESARFLFGLDSNPDGKCGQHCTTCAYYEVVLMIKQGQSIAHNDIVPRSCAHSQLLYEAAKRSRVAATEEQQQHHE